MRRRDFFTSAVATTAALSASCNPEQSGIEAQNIITGKKYEWIMVTTWPPGFPILHEACIRLADQVRTMSGGRLHIKVYGAGELIPAFECFEAVSLGTAALTWNCA